MKKVFLLLAITLPIYCSQTTIAAEMIDKDFQAFYAVFSKAMKSGEMHKVYAMMADDFQWAYDPVTVNKKQAFEMANKEQGLWTDFVKTLDQKPEKTESFCENAQCYEIISLKMHAGYLFKKINGQWKWYGFLAD